MSSGAQTSNSGQGGQPDYSAAWAMYYQQMYQQQAAGQNTAGNAAQGIVEIIIVV